MICRAAEPSLAPIADSHTGIPSLKADAGSAFCVRGKAMVWLCAAFLLLTPTKGGEENKQKEADNKARIKRL